MHEDETSRCFAVLLWVSLYRHVRIVLFDPRSLFHGYFRCTTSIRREKRLPKNEIESKTKVRVTEDNCRVHGEDYRGSASFLDFVAQKESGGGQRNK